MKYHKWKSYDVWFLRYWAQFLRTEFFCYLGLFFALLPALKSKKKKKFKKMKTTPGYIMIYHKCTQNYDHMLYCSWDKARDKGNCYFSFWAIFCPFTPLTAQKLKISKTYKKILDISFILASSVSCREVRDSWITEVSEAIIIAVTISEGKDLHPFWSFKSFEYFAINFINLF